ncbi:MAG TPA: hypothetical protein VF054_04290 [Micromonosporaceae bacterium]
MAGERPPKDSWSSGINTGWAVVGYLIAGMAVWGFLGWLVDRWLHLGGIGMGIGVVLGAAGAIYLIVRRFGA